VALNTIKTKPNQTIFSLVNCIIWSQYI